MDKDKISMLPYAWCSSKLLQNEQAETSKPSKNLGTWRTHAPTPQKNGCNILPCTELPKDSIFLPVKSQLLLLKTNKKQRFCIKQICDHEPTMLANNNQVPFLLTHEGLLKRSNMRIKFVVHANDMTWTCRQSTYRKESTNSLWSFRLSHKPTLFFFFAAF